MITFVSCWYEVKAKYDKTIYINWISNLLSNVKNFKLVIFSDKNSSKILIPFIDINTNIKLVIKPLTEFYNYKYKDNWIHNHSKNYLLYNKSGWELNMLWSEKISFVKYVIDNKIFNNELYGWCDIGYFRGKQTDIKTELILNWPNENKLKLLDKTKIHYANICNNISYIDTIYKLVKDKNALNLPKNPINPNKGLIAGGFFILDKCNINWWWKTYDEKLKLYFDNNYLVKDDQIIIIDCIFSNLQRFKIHEENNKLYDNWFMFQRILL